MPQESTNNAPVVELSTVSETENNTIKQSESIEVEQSEEVQESNSIQRKNHEGIVGEKDPSKFDLSTNNSKALVGVIGLVASLMFPPAASFIFLGTVSAIFAPEIAKGVKKISSGLSEKSTLKTLEKENQKLLAQVKEQAPIQTTIGQNENLGPQKAVEIDGVAGRILEEGKNLQSFTQTTNVPLSSKNQLPNNQGNGPKRVKSSFNIKR